ncbi:MAG: SHOCT domain-containing protein [Sedimentibacter sp.]|uniref:SHOCT domain-containing protein n=1 Tax=Sedimentibacter sp. TaxID=1960295 RepID=UPI00315850E6
MFIIPLLTVVFVIWLIFYAFGNSHTSFYNNNPINYSSNQGYSKDKALEILRERYARGEVSDEEYQKIKRNLEL